MHLIPILDLPARRRIPAMYELPAAVEEGGLMAYGPSLAEMDRQVASIVHRIIKGATPGELPIQQPTKFELAINLKAARALNLRIPEGLLLRADTVIE